MRWYKIWYLRINDTDHMKDITCRTEENTYVLMKDTDLEDMYCEAAPMEAEEHPLTSSGCSCLSISWWGWISIQLRTNPCIPLQVNYFSQLFLVASVCKVCISGQYQIEHYGYLEQKHFQFSRLSIEFIIKILFLAFSYWFLCGGCNLSPLAKLKKSNNNSDTWHICVRTSVKSVIAKTKNI